MEARFRVLVLFFALTSCPVALPGQPVAVPSGSAVGEPEPSRGCPLAGRVVDAAGAPVAGATVAAWPRSVPTRETEDYEPPSAVTGSDGRFRIDAVFDGAAIVIVEAPGRPFYALRGIETPCPPLEVAAPATLRLPPGGDLAGRIVDGEGQPLAGVRVEVPGHSQRPGWLPQRYWDEPHAEVRTTGNGRFQVPGLATGSPIILRLRREGFVTRYLQRGEMAAGGTVLPDLVLERSGAVRVRVTDERTGRPVEGAHVRPRRVGEEEIGGGIVESFDTGEDGSARIESLAPGAYRVGAWRSGFASRGEALVEVRSGATAEAAVVLASAPGADVEVSLRPAGVPLKGAEVFLERLRGEPRYHEKQVLTAADGSLVFREVPFGRYRLMASHTSYPGLVRREIDFAPGATRFELAFEEPPAGWVPVFGRVVDDQGQPVPGAKVYVSGSTPGLTASYETMTDDAGRFTLDAIAADRYWVQASTPASELRPARLRFEARPPRTGELVLTLRRGIEVTGAVEGLPADELTAVEVRATAEDALGMQVAAWGYVGPDGTYHLEGVTPGSWSIEAVWDGAAAARADLTVPERGEALTGPDLVFAERYTVSGTLLYQGRPYAGVRVGLSPEERGLSFMQGVGGVTDDRGRFTLEPVSAGAYHFTVRDPAWGQVHHELLEVTGDLDRTFPLGAAMVSGEVLDAETGLPVPEAHVNLGQLGLTVASSHAFPTWAELDPEARFEIGPLGEGRWRLKASAEGYVPNDFRIEVEGEDLEGLIIPLTPTPGLDLLVRTAAGAVPEQVDLRLENPEAACTVAKHVLHPHGAAENRWPDAPPGEWELLAWDETGACARVPAAVPGPVVEVVLPALAKLEVRVPDLEAEEGSATLQLLDANGSPAASRACATEGHDRWPIRSNRRFYAFGLEPGVYEARVTAADGRAWTGTVDLVPGTGSVITLD